MKHRDAHRDPALRRFLERRALEQGMVAIIRYSATDGFVLVPPSMVESGQWLEVTHGMREKEHSFADIVEALQSARP